MPTTAPVPPLSFPLFHPGSEPGWKITASERKFDNPHVSVDLNHYLTPGRPVKPQPWMVVGRKAAVAIAPRLADGRFVLIAQERLPVRQTLWEFPAGQIDTETTCESIVATSLNELREEAGLALEPETGKLTPMGWFFPSQGFTDEIVYLFHAEPVCVASQPEPEGSEHISSVRFASAGELRRMIAENEITNALSLALFARMAAKGLL
ncbi:MAG: NUDIX hydrolase [Verrucomicrobiaceae bacterium]|nr:NUDIX hydrolase [Verrucomicrobiaceae bacterium]